MNLITMRKSLVLLSCLTLLAACEPTIATRGNLVDADKLAEVKIDTSTREDVVNQLGSPTQVGTFDENVWYYFGRRTEQYAFFNPEVMDQKAVEIRFDDQGVVTAVNKLDSAAAHEVDPVTRRTPTYGHDVTFLEQLMGNMGRPTAPRK